MPLEPIKVNLSDGQKVSSLKRFQIKYRDEMTKIEIQIGEILTSLAEADFVAQYLGEQPEVMEMRARKAELDGLEKRRQYLGKLLERLDQCIPAQPEIALSPPNASVGSTQK